MEKFCEQFAAAKIASAEKEKPVDEAMSFDQPQSEGKAHTFEFSFGDALRGDGKRNACEDQDHHSGRPKRQCVLRQEEQAKKKKK